MSLRSQFNSLDLRKKDPLDLRKEVLPSVISPEVSTSLEIICTPEITEEDDAIWVDSTPEPAAPEEELLQGFPDIYNQMMQQLECCDDANAEIVIIQESPQKIEKGDVFPTWKFSEKEAVNVDEIPENINGKALYRISTERQNLNRKTQDRWHFKMSTSMVAGFEERRRVGWCSGSWKCINPECPFLLTSPHWKPNCHSWVKKSCRTI